MEEDENAVCRDDGKNNKIASPCSWKDFVAIFMAKKEQSCVLLQREAIAVHPKTRAELRTQNTILWRLNANKISI